MSDLRIVSLLPSATEIVCALGFRDALVGRSHECDYPPGVEKLPVLTAPKADVSGNSLEIHESVKSALHGGDGVYSVDIELLRDLGPTHVVTQAQCDVCAVSLRDVESALSMWSGSEAPRITTLKPNRLQDVYEDILRTATDLGNGEAGRSLVASMKQRVSAAASKVTIENRPRVAAIEWISPLMFAGNWMPELIEIAGGTSVSGDLRETDPDIIVLMPCGFDIERTLRDMDLLESCPGWHDLRAVREGCLYVTDGNQYFNRPGPRLADSVEILAEIVQRSPLLSRIGRSIATSTTFSIRSP